MHRFLALLLVAGCAFAQDAQNAPADGKSAHLTAPPQVSTQVTERLMPVSHSDLYCSGYLAKAPVKNDSYVMGGLNSPNATRFHARDYIFINGDYAPGSRVSFIRQTKDPDRLDSFEGQTKALKQTGAIFGELGYAVVVEKRGSATVAQVEFACDAIVPGDYAVPFVEKPEVHYRQHSTADRFPDRAQTVGRIIAARDFDQYVANGQKVYFNVGSQKGLKPGDMFYVVRNYSMWEMDLTDRGELKTGAFEETRVNEPKMPKHMEDKMPERVIAEAVVLSANENSATAMITFALSEVHVGDRVASETEKGNPTGGAMAKSEHNLKPNLSKLCVFAVLGCDEPSTTEAPAGNATAAAPAAGHVSGGSK